MARKVRPTVVAGIGEWGARVVAAFAGRVERQAGPVPVVRAVALDSGSETGWATALAAELEQVRRLDAVQATRRAGIKVETHAGSAVVLVASLDEDSRTTRLSLRPELRPRGSPKSCSGHSENGNHDPGVTLEDENPADVEQDSVLLYGCRQDAILPYGHFRSGNHDPGVTLKDENRADVEQDSVLLYERRQDAILPYGYSGSSAMVLEVARWLRRRSGLDPAHGLALSGVFLLSRPEAALQISHKTLDPPSQGQPSEPLDPPSRGRPMQQDAISGKGFRPQDTPEPAASLAERKVAESKPPEPLQPPSRGRPTQQDADPILRAIVSPHLFDEGCYLLDQVNADGLLVDDGEKQADAVANWLALWVLTPLQEVLDHGLPGGTGHRYDTFGIAAWEFPCQALVDHLVCRWQRDVLDALLAPAPDDRGTVRSFLEQHGTKGALWPRDAALRFRVSGDAWSSPPLDLIPVLSQEIERAVEEERARLRDLVLQGAKSLDPLCDEAARALAAKVDALLDGPGLAEGERFLTGLQESAQARATRAEQEAQRYYARVDELDGPAGEAGQALDELLARFPPLRLRVLLGLALRPWRLLSLWLLYRQIGRQAGVCLAYRQSQWLLQVAANEHEWQAAFYARLACAAGEQSNTLAQLRGHLERARERLGDEAGDAGPSLARALEAATLPAEIVDHFYRRATSDADAALLALYGPLSRWARDGCEVESLSIILAEHAREQFAFLDRTRLDELLAHTHGGMALRRHLAALVEAATPWWAYDEAALDADDRARLSRRVLVGLPDVSDSLLVDLLPDRVLSHFSTGDRHQVVAIQVIQGFRIGEQRLEMGE